MNTQIQNLENKINDLVVRMNNAEETLTTNATTEINALRSELQKLINEFDLLKIKMQDENSDATITEDDIESLINLIDSFISDCATNNFSSETFYNRNIDDVELSVNYSCEVELESATIDVDDYFCENFSCDYDDFIKYVDRAGLDEYGFLVKFITRELFELINEIIETSVRNIDTSVSFSRFEDFECEMDSYKKIEVTEITIDGDEMSTQFTNEFDFDRTDIENIIKNYHNFKSEEISEENNSDNSEENNSEE
jgi:hypothetical protein